MADEYEDGLIGAERQPQVRDRDQGGKFIRAVANPEPMFRERVMEESGEQSGAVTATRSREQEIADGYEPTEQAAPRQERTGRQPTRTGSEDSGRSASDDGHELFYEEPENIAAESGDGASDGQLREGEREEADEGPRYEVTVDGEQVEVSLQEALAGYIRTATFHKRASELGTIQRQIEASNAKLNEGWQLWNKARLDYEEDFANLIPPEINWTQAFKAATGNAAQLSYLADQQENYRVLYGKLAASRQARANREAAAEAEAEASLREYAINGHARFLAMHPKVFTNEAERVKNIDSMRRTAFDAGFNENEVSQIFDPRMQTVLLWASRFRRMTAAPKPVAVVPGKGRTLAPGSSTPATSRNVPRKELDEAMSRLQKSGRLDDAADVFRQFTG